MEDGSFGKDFAEIGGAWNEGEKLGNEGKGELMRTNQSNNGKVCP